MLIVLWVSKCFDMWSHMSNKYKNKIAIYILWIGCISSYDFSVRLVLRFQFKDLYVYFLILQMLSHLLQYEKIVHDYHKEHTFLVRDLMLYHKYTTTLLILWQCIFLQDSLINLKHFDLTIVNKVNIHPRTALLLQCVYWIFRPLAQVCGAVKGNEPAIKQL